MLNKSLLIAVIAVLSSTAAWSKEVSDLGKLKQTYDFMAIGVSKMQANDGGGDLYAQKKAAFVTLNDHVAEVLMEQVVYRDKHFGESIVRTIGHHRFDCLKKTLHYGGHDAYSDHGDFLFELDGIEDLGLSVNKKAFVADTTASLTDEGDKAREAVLAAAAFDRLQKIACDH